MKKITLVSNGINEFADYLKRCEFEVSNNLVKMQSSTFKTLVLYHIEQIKFTLQTRYLQMLQKGKADITVKFNPAELAVCSYLFKHVPVTHYMATIEFKILEGLTT